MESKQEVMVAIGAAVGANCIPCFDFIYAKAKEMNLDQSDIQDSIQTALKVKNGAAVFMKKAIGEVVDSVDDPQETCCEALGGDCGCNG